MRTLRLTLKIDPFDGRNRPRITTDPLQLLGLFIACDLAKRSDCDVITRLLDFGDFSFWGEATRAISEVGEEVRVFEPGSSLYCLVPRDLLRQVLDEWCRFIADHEERTSQLSFEPTVLEVADDGGVVVGSFESELAQYFEGDTDENGYTDTGVVRSWIPNSEQYEEAKKYVKTIGAHYALALTEDGRWVLIDDRRRIGGTLRRSFISGPEAQAWMDRNKVHYWPGRYPFD